MNEGIEITNDSYINSSRSYEEPNPVHKYNIPKLTLDNLIDLSIELPG